MYDEHGAVLPKTNLTNMYRQQEEENREHIKQTNIAIEKYRMVKAMKKYKNVKMANLFKNWV